jgi:hypothetical protein
MCLTVQVQMYHDAPVRAAMALSAGEPSLLFWMNLP